MDTKLLFCVPDVSGCAVSSSLSGSRKFGRRMVLIEPVPRNPREPTALQEPRRTILSSLAEVAQAIGHLNRLELLEFLAQGHGLTPIVL